MKADHLLLQGLEVGAKGRPAGTKKIIIHGQVSLRTQVWDQSNEKVRPLGDSSQVQVKPCVPPILRAGETILSLSLELDSQ